MDDLERELDGDDNKRKCKFKTGNPGKCSYDTIFTDSQSRKPGDIGKQAAKSNQVQKQLWDKEQVRKERLRRLKEKECK